MADLWTGNILMMTNPVFLLIYYKCFSGHPHSSHLYRLNTSTLNCGLVVDQGCFHISYNLVMVITLSSCSPHSHHAKYLIVTNSSPWRISTTFPSSLILSSPHLEAHAYLFMKQFQERKKKEIICGLYPPNHLLRTDIPRFHIQWPSNQRWLGVLNKRSGTTSCLML